MKAQQQLQLNCGWNSTTREDTQQLQCQVLDAFKTQSPSDDVSDIAQVLADKLSGMDANTALQSVARGRRRQWCSTY